jgi:hypothetical protein
MFMDRMNHPRQQIAPLYIALINTLVKPLNSNKDGAGAVLLDQAAC